MFFFYFFAFFYFFISFFFFFSFFWGGLLLDYFLFTFSGVDFSFSFVFDFVSLGFFSCVSFISGLVFLYSIFYMQGTVDFRRFFWLVFGFVASMFFLVFSGNFLFLMVGWDGLGLVSFCLVIFYSNHSSLESGLITVFSNRVGDVFFLFCFYFFYISGWFSFDSGAWLASSLFFSFVFLGAVTKSAQIPFSAWLPAAMAAPTPVSSLVHSSTLVTAGVYVLVRYFYLFFFFDWVYLKFFFIFTMLLAGICASLESDFKKVVAMSTLSQLGMMLFILSVGAWVLCYLHMIIHAFFKSMLFLSTGALMSQYGGGQDSRFYSGSVYSFGPSLCFLASCVCLSGFPFFIGFYSKDFIIFSCSLGLGLMFYFSFLVGCLFTVFYSFRLFFLGCFSFYKGFSTLGFLDGFKCLFSVLMLFFKSWLLGGVFYWLFLSGSCVFFSFFDLLVGVFLMLLGFFMYNKLYFFYEAFVFFCFISYMRWFSSGGSSFLFGKKVYHKFDSSWSEILGGQGVYTSLSTSSTVFGFYKYIGLGVFYTVVVVSVWFFIV